MDYKEKYEMALEGIQEILGSGEDSIMMSRLQIRLQGIFPELAESKDERIRKSLLDYFANFKPDDMWDNDFLCSDILAWLEKQGEKPIGIRLRHATGKLGEIIKNIESSDKVETKFKVGDLVKDCNYKGEPIYEIQGIDSKCYICKYIGKENLGDGTVMHFSLNNPYLKLVEQKPTWSEEDERLCQCLIKDQEEALDEVRNDKYGHAEIISDLKEMYNGRISWLKSLKQRIGG